MKKLILSTLLFSELLYANELQLNCTALLNYEKLKSAQLTLTQDESNFRWGEYQSFRFLISKKNNSIELQLFDGNEPSRTYAAADFTNNNSVELTIWKNDYLLSLKCVKP